MEPRLRDVVGAGLLTVVLVGLVMLIVALAAPTLT
jgi:hypothetical protein